jgi:gluconate 5-dehydrogenase
MGILDLFRLDGKHAVVTGASRGLGRSMALALADVGADVVITGRTQETLDATAAEIRALGRQAWTVQADMGVPAECQATCELILRDFGPIDILINNVGNREVSVAIEAEPLATWQRMIDLNLTSCFIGTKLIGAAMLARGKGGRIINIASISALIANRGIGGATMRPARRRCCISRAAPQPIGHRMGSP